MKLSSNCQNSAPHTFPSAEHTVVKNISSRNNTNLQLQENMEDGLQSYDMKSSLMLEGCYSICITQLELQLIKLKGDIYSHLHRRNSQL